MHMTKPPLRRPSWQLQADQKSNKDRITTLLLKIHKRNCRTPTLILQCRKCGWKTTSLTVHQNFNLKVSSEHGSCLTIYSSWNYYFQIIIKQVSPSLCTFCTFYSSYYMHTQLFSAAESAAQNSVITLLPTFRIKYYKKIMRHCAI